MYPLNTTSLLRKENKLPVIYQYVETWREWEMYTQKYLSTPAFCMNEKVEYFQHTTKNRPECVLLIFTLKKLNWILKI